VTSSTPRGSSLGEPLLPRIRAARPSDAAAIARVHVEGWRETYPGIVPRSVLDRLDIADRARYWSAVLREPGRDSDLFVADTAEGIVGFGMSGPEQVGLRGYDGEFQALYLLRVGQGRGLGRRLMAVMAAALLVRGWTSATVWTLRPNTRARRFYERLGGQPIGERQLDFDGSAVPEVAYGWADIGIVAADRDPADRP
jgi:GNAT superfamily N-acetyltransferase